VKVIVGIFLIINTINPKLIWRITEGWRYKNVEPSDSYLYFSRLISLTILLLFLLAMCVD